MFESGEPMTYDLRPSQKWGAGTAIGDLMLYDRIGERCAATWEEKPKLHSQRISDIYRDTASTFPSLGESPGIFIDRVGDVKYQASTVSISQSEMHVYIQVNQTPFIICPPRPADFRSTGSRAVLFLQHSVLYHQRTSMSSACLPQSAERSGNRYGDTISQRYRWKQGQIYKHSENTNRQ